MATSLKKLSSVVQKASGKHTATLIFMHGLGDSGSGWATIGEELTGILPHVKFIFPNAPSMPVTMNHGMHMPSWYDIKNLSKVDDDKEQDEQGMLKSNQQLMQIVREEVEVAGIPANRIVIGGFSQGCVMGLLLSLTSEFKFAGVVALSGYLPLHSKIFNMATEANKKTPIFWGHGDADQVVRYEYGQRSVEQLQKHKYAVRFNTYPDLGHGFGLEEFRDLSAFLRETLRPVDTASA
ncbi:acyl-protein thioesterase-1 [Gamsiella multidivaricata]|uniref:acyl-protein thioesterase-1 n=1 Tax=Gamsiella multidivaricata TaxID=101098 RepID=UPI00221FEBF8|nr:acyl-protein thioesterase-1 [Gamsiella multidivaricata]KAI7819431.1 acyl-protein thioesterase-1 [Gamsiella multidivaricata]